MMKKHLFLFLLLTGALCIQINAQDTLPNFSVRNVGNKRIIISWKNNYGLTKQISIQRSPDSLKNYRTIATLPDPMNRENGYVDMKAPNDSMFYRLFIVLDGVMYIFTPPKKPRIDSVKKSIATNMEANITVDSVTPKKILDPFSIDVNRPTNGGMDSSFNLNNHDQKVKPNIYVPSMFVYTARDGNVHLNLPDAETKKYSIKFYDEKFIFLFEIKNLKESSLIIDKTNFYHAGWFNFELYVDDKFKEKNKFYIEKEF